MKINLFQKLLLLLLILLVPLICVYAYSYSTSVNVINEQIEKLNGDRLGFFLKQINDETSQLAALANIVSQDPSVQALQRNPDVKIVEKLELIGNIERQLRLQTMSSKWHDYITFTVYYPARELALSNIRPSTKVPPYEFVEQPWTYVQAKPGQAAAFVHQDTDPQFGFSDSEPVQQITQIRFSVNVLAKMLAQLNDSGQGETFLYAKGLPPIMRAEADNRLVKAMIEEMAGMESLAGLSNHVIALDGQNVLVNVRQADSLGWLLVDLVPINTILEPINQSRNLFYTALIALLLISILATLWLYKHIQQPISHLLRGVKRVRQGNYNVRVPENAHYEFQILSVSFNQMTEEIQNLVEKVYAEQIHAREIRLKQLQSQINPHFLYNCLYFIKNMTVLDEKKAVIAMVVNLGKYYRYATRTEEQQVELHEEIELLESYLKIQTLRMKRLHYSISIPEEMREIVLPRLLIQPLVENAIVHGLEPCLEDGMLEIAGEQDEYEYRIHVKDNGIGMTEKQAESLRASLDQTHQPERGYGIWNVQQRLKLHYGAEAGLSVFALPEQGVEIIMKWPKKERVNEHVQHSDRG